MNQQLPEIQGSMPIAQGIFLEVLHMLVEENIVTEAAAIKRYEIALSKHKSWR